MDALVVSVAVGVVWLTEGEQCPNQVPVRLMKDSRAVGPCPILRHPSDPDYAQGGLSSLQQKLQLSVPYAVANFANDFCFGSAVGSFHDVACRTKAILANDSPFETVKIADVGVNPLLELALSWKMNILWRRSSRRFWKTLCCAACVTRFVPLRRRWPIRPRTEIKHLNKETTDSHFWITNLSAAMGKPESRYPKKYTERSQFFFHDNKTLVCSCCYCRTFRTSLCCTYEFILFCRSFALAAKLIRRKNTFSWILLSFVPRWDSHQPTFLSFVH